MSLADIYIRAGERDRAVLSLKKALERHPDDTWIRKRLEDLKKEIEEKK